MEISDALTSLARTLETEADFVLEAAEDTPAYAPTLTSVANAVTALEDAAAHLKSAGEADLEKLVSLANLLDRSHEPEYVKYAKALDGVLESLAQKKPGPAATEKLRTKLRKTEIEDKYEKDYAELAKREDQGAEVHKLWQDQITPLRPLQDTLSTRYCPDHPGTSTVTIGTNVMQCPLDRRIYDWTKGFTTYRGKKYPGGDVANQIRQWDTGQGQFIFDTRDERMNRYASDGRVDPWAGAERDDEDPEDFDPLALKRDPEEHAWGPARAKGAQLSSAPDGTVDARVEEALEMDGSTPDTPEAQKWSALGGDASIDELGLGSVPANQLIERVKAVLGPDAEVILDDTDELRVLKGSDTNLLDDVEDTTEEIDTGGTFTDLGELEVSPISMDSLDELSDTPAEIPEGFPRTPAAEIVLRHGGDLPLEVLAEELGLPATDTVEIERQLQGEAADGPDDLFADDEGLFHLYDPPGRSGYWVGLTERGRALAGV